MTIETARTFIREFELTDAPAVLAFNSNQAVTRFTGDAGMVKNLNDAKAVIENIWLKEYQTFGYGRWAVVDKASNKVIGFCGLKHIQELGMPDIGYRFLPEFWGKGYATETAFAAVKYAQEKLNVDQFFGDVMEQNHASVKLLKKLGLKFNGYIEHGSDTFMRFMQTSPTMLNIHQFYK